MCLRKDRLTGRHGDYPNTRSYDEVENAAVEGLDVTAMLLEERVEIRWLSRRCVHSSSVKTATAAGSKKPAVAGGPQDLGSVRPSPARFNPGIRVMGNPSAQLQLNPW